MIYNAAKANNYSTLTLTIDLKLETLNLKQKNNPLTA